MMVHGYRLGGAGADWKFLVACGSQASVVFNGLASLRLFCVAAAGLTMRLHLPIQKEDPQKR